MDDRRRGLKLIEVMVIVGVIGLLMGVVIIPIRNARALGRRAQCQNNMKNLGLALVQFSTNRNYYPNAGTFFDDPAVHGGDPAKSNIYRAIVNPASLAGKNNPCLKSWVLDIMPYLDSNDFKYDFKESYLSTKSSGPSQPGNFSVCTTSLAGLHCPEDPTYRPNQGNLSYAVNGGFARWYPIPVGWAGGKKDGQARNGGVLNWTDDRNPLGVGRKLGVMFLGTHTGDQPWDVKTTPSGISDGASNTLLLGENTLVGYSPGTTYSGGLPTNWGCPLPNFCMFLGSDDVCRSTRSETDCLAGQLKPGPRGETGAGWSWASRAGSFERMNYGADFTVEGSFPFVNSGHPGGSNFIFCDGSLRFVSRSIDGTVYARLITPAGGALPAPIRQGNETFGDLNP